MLFWGGGVALMYVLLPTVLSVAIRSCAEHFEGLWIYSAIDEEVCVLLRCSSDLSDARPITRHDLQAIDSYDEDGSPHILYPEGYLPPGDSTYVELGASKLSAFGRCPDSTLYVFVVPYAVIVNEAWDQIASTESYRPVCALSVGRVDSLDWTLQLSRTSSGMTLTGMTDEVW